MTSMALILRPLLIAPLTAVSVGAVKMGILESLKWWGWGGVGGGGGGSYLNEGANYPVELFSRLE